VLRSMARLFLGATWCAANPRPKRCATAYVLEQICVGASFRSRVCTAPRR
jgi:hypothetical protein